MSNQLQQPNVVDFQDALTLRDHLKRSTDPPLLHANETKDTTAGRWLIERFEVATMIATCDDWCNVQELARILGGCTISWWENWMCLEWTKQTGKTSFIQPFQQKY